MLAIVPAVLWLVFFYLQDRVEPEPVGHVAQMFVIGLALAGAIGVPLSDQVFRTQDWLFRDAGSTLIGAVFVRGAIEMFIIYATVRYFMFDSPEFDERTDGVIYGTAAGLGYATFINIAMVANSGGIAAEELGAGVIRIVIVTLVQATLGGLTGYFIARTKFDDEPLWWMPAGLTLAAVINGLFSWLAGEITTSPLTISATGASGGYNPWPALALAAVVAVALLGVTFALMRRANQLTLAGADADQK